MEFGVQFFPSVGPDKRSAEQYWGEALQLTQRAEQLGYANVRTVEHYFHPYGGYSPDPLIFLSAAAAMTRTIRLITGAVLPVFNNPLKLAGQIGMVDAISKGRLEVGFARAFLPHEFARFGISMDESRSRFDEGLEQIRRLLEEENVTAQGRFHSFEKVTSLPRPTQKPRPPFWIAALSTKESFETAGRQGHHLMGIPLAGAQMAELIKIYRDAWKAAGHPGQGRVMLAFHMFCAETREKAAAIAREPLNIYLRSIVNAASDWMSGVASKDYPNYQKTIEFLSKETFESQVAKGGAWIGTPGMPTHVGFDGPALKGAENVVLPGADHRETSFSPQAFVEMYRFITGREPSTRGITPEASVVLDGKVSGLGLNNEPGRGGEVNNIPLALATVEAFAVDVKTGERLGPAVHHQVTGAGGRWGPFTASPSAHYEFVISAPGYATTHIYRSPFPRSSDIVDIKSQPSADCVSGRSVPSST